jgi:hypothetical protein
MVSKVHARMLAVAWSQMFSHADSCKAAVRVKGLNMEVGIGIYRYMRSLRERWENQILLG